MALANHPNMLGRAGSGVTSSNAVTSLTGTANQVIVSAPTGAVTISLSPTLAGINSITSATGTALTLATFAGSNKNLILAPDGTGTVSIGAVGAGSASVPTLTGNTGATNTGLWWDTTNNRLSMIVGGVTAFQAFSTGAPIEIQTAWKIYPATDNAAGNTIGRGANRYQEMFLGPTGASISGATPSASSGLVSSADKCVKAVASIADNTATAVLTATIPNAAHSGTLRVRLVGSLGAGGAIGANEATACVSYDFAIARTAGVNAVVVASAAYGIATASVAGASIITVTAAASAVSGAVGATNTFTVNITIAHTTGSSTNHTCMLIGEIINANATGITIV